MAFPSVTAALRQGSRSAKFHHQFQRIRRSREMNQPSCPTRPSPSHNRTYPARSRRRRTAMAPSLTKLDAESSYPAASELLYPTATTFPVHHPSALPHRPSSFIVHATSSVASNIKESVSENAAPTSFPFMPYLPDPTFTTQSENSVNTTDNDHSTANLKSIHSKMRSKNTKKTAPNPPQLSTTQSINLSNIYSHMTPHALTPPPPIGPRGVPPITMSLNQLSDHNLLLLSSLENHSAREEILRRHIMDIDHCTYEQACHTFDSIAAKNLEGYYLSALPYEFGILCGTVAGIVTIPMVFHLPTVEWFNEWAVTTEVPPSKDLETPLEVSIWSWNWMEPPLGTLSFLLLCMQYIRSQMSNLGIKPYTHWVKKFRGKKLAFAFPKYNAEILIAYSETAHLVDVQLDGQRFAKDGVWKSASKKFPIKV